MTSSSSTDDKRYEIGATADDWTEAERSVAKASSAGEAGTLTVAVKTGEKKRKAGEAVAEAYKESEKYREKGEKKVKKAKQSRR